MKAKVDHIKVLQLTIEYDNIKLRNTFRTAKAAAKWYSEQRNNYHYKDLPYNPDRKIAEKSYRRVLPIFQKYLP